MRDWRKTLQRERQTRGGPPGCGYFDYILSAHYKGVYFAEHQDDNDPECLRRARAVKFMLENLPLTWADDREFFGAAEQIYRDELPEEITQAQYETAFAAFNAHGHRRRFSIGNDHVAPDYFFLMEKGLGALLRRTEEGVNKYGSDYSKAMHITVQAVSDFFRRAGEYWMDKRPDSARRLINLATEPPADFAEALQLMWLIFVVLEADCRTHNALARIDQYLYPAYKKSHLDHDTALNYLCHIFTAVEGFHEVTNICIGGVKAADGSDAANELSLLALEATLLVHSASTNLSARLHKNTNPEFLNACAHTIIQGIGFPAVFNDENNIPMLTQLGIPVEAARDYACFGCVEPLIPGRQVAWSDGRFNLPECLLEALRELPQCSGYDELWKKFEDSVRRHLQLYTDEYNRQLAEYNPVDFPDPLLSAFINDCPGRGIDINAGGAEFPRLHGVCMMGLGTLADSMAAIRKLVFQEKRIAPQELLEALQDNFQHYEIIRQTLRNCAPKYGNDLDECDDIACNVVEMCGRLCQEFRTLDGGFFLSCMSSNVQNIPAGANLGATPDGRLAGTPLSDAASPSAGCDRNGPTAFVNSIVKPDYRTSACTVVNMRFTPKLFESPSGENYMTAILRRFVDGGGQEMQFNVTDNTLLSKALENPEQYADLLIRVSGFSAYFTKLDPEIQQDIMRRNAHGNGQTTAGTDL